MPTVTRDGAAIAYEVAGPEPGGGAARAVVLLHNIFCDRRVFEGAVAALRARRRTIAIDFRGHGESSLGARRYGVDDLVADVVAVLDQEGVATADVVGLSIGATVAMELALAHPSRVGRLVLMGADAEPDGGISSARNALFCQLVMLFGMRWFILAGVTNTLFGASFRRETPADFAVFRRRIGSLQRRAARQAMRAWTGRRPLLEALARLRNPTRIVVGDEDVSCPLPCGERVQRALPGAELVRIARAGHTMTAERPRETAEAIVSFLQ